MLSLVLSTLLFLPSAHADGFIVDALVAKVGRDPILYSDLLRFKEIEVVINCSEGRAISKEQEPEPLINVLTRYVEEELVHQELKTKKNIVTKPLRQAIDAVMDKADCKARWLDLGSRYSRLWSTPSRPREGEALLVREFEKRLSVRSSDAAVLQEDKEVWLRGARLRTPIKLFLEQ